MAREQPEERSGVRGGEGAPRVHPSLPEFCAARARGVSGAPCERRAAAESCRGYLANREQTGRVEVVRVTTVMAQDCTR